MRVSVIIPTYNRAASVVAAVASVLAQTYRDFELIVIDDGSTDDTVERLAPIRDPRLRCVPGTHAGVAAARNAGVAVATGEVVAFLDSDDAWRSDKLERDVAFLRGHPEVAAVFSDLEKHHGDQVVPSFMRQTAVFARWLAGRVFPDGVALGRREMFLMLLEEVPIKPSALAVRRAAFQEAGGFDESWTSSEDWEFLLRFARRFRFGYIDRPLAVLRISPDSLHILDQTRGETAMIRLLRAERGRLIRDREGRAAVRRGLVGRFLHFGWHFLDAGRSMAAAGVFAHGFAVTGEVGLLLRAVAALPGARAAVRTLRSLQPARRAHSEASVATLIGTS